MPPVADRVLKLMQDANSIATNTNLDAINHRFVQKLDIDAANGDAYAKEVVRKIEDALPPPGTIQDHASVRAIRTHVAEAKIFYRLRAALGIRRVPESKVQNVKTADFEVTFGNGVDTATFPTEIKAPDFVGGDAACNKHMDRALDAKIEVERQTRAGQSFAAASYRVSPWGDSPTVGKVTAALIDKIRQNVKRDQLAGKHGGILIIDLPKWHLPLGASADKETCRTYRHVDGTTSSGILWHTAFGKLNDPLTDFDGRADQPLAKTGIMHEYSEITVLSFCVSGTFCSFVRPMQNNMDALVREMLCEFSHYANDDETPNVKLFPGHRLNEW